MGFRISKDLPELEELGPKLVSKLKASCQREVPKAGLVSLVTRACKGQSWVANTALIPEDRVLSPPAQSLQGRSSPLGQLPWVSHLSLSLSRMFSDW